MKKIVVKLNLRDDRKEKQKAMKVVSTLQGIDSLAVHTNERKMTVIGSVDPVDVVSKLRKFWKTADIFSVGPAKEEEEKKEEPKKEEAKNDEAKEDKKEEGKKDEKKEPHKGMIEELLSPYNPHMHEQLLLRAERRRGSKCLQHHVRRRKDLASLD